MVGEWAVVVVGARHTHTRDEQTDPHADQQTFTQATLSHTPTNTRTHIHTDNHTWRARAGRAVAAVFAIADAEADHEEVKVRLTTRRRIAG